MPFNKKSADKYLQQSEELIKAIASEMHDSITDIVAKYENGHNTKVPLAAIIGALDLIGAGQLSEGYGIEEAAKDKVALLLHKTQKRRCSQPIDDAAGMHKYLLSYLTVVCAKDLKWADEKER